MFKDKTIVYPATARDINNTVIILETEDAGNR